MEKRRVLSDKKRRLIPELEEIELLDCIDVFLSLVIIVLDIGALLICITSCREFAAALRTVTESASQSDVVTRQRSVQQNHQIQLESQTESTSSIQAQTSLSVGFLVKDCNLPSSSKESQGSTHLGTESKLDSPLEIKMFEEDRERLKYSCTFGNYQRSDKIDLNDSLKVSEEKSKYKTRHLQSYKDVQALRDHIAIREYLTNRSPSVPNPYQASTSNRKTPGLSLDDDSCGYKTINEPSESKSSSLDDEIARLTNELSLEILESAAMEEDEVHYKHLNQSLENEILEAVAMDQKYLQESLENKKKQDDETPQKPPIEAKRDRLSPKPANENREYNLSPVGFELRTPTPINWNEVPQGDASPSAIPSWAVLPDLSLDKTG